MENHLEMEDKNCVFSFHLKRKTDQFGVDLSKKNGIIGEVDGMNE